MRNAVTEVSAEEFLMLNSLSDKIFNTVNYCRHKQLFPPKYLDSSWCSILLWRNCMHGTCFFAFHHCIFSSSPSYKQLVYLHRYLFVQPYKCDPEHLFLFIELTRLSEICLCFSDGIVWLLEKKKKKRKYWHAGTSAIRLEIFFLEKIKAAQFKRFCWMPKVLWQNEFLGWEAYVKRSLMPRSQNTWSQKGSYQSLATSIYNQIYIYVK